MLAIAKTSTPQLPLAVTKQNLPILRTTPLPSRWSGQRRFSSAARPFGAHLKIRAPHSPFLQERFRANRGALSQKRGSACASIYKNYCACQNDTFGKAHPICRKLTAPPKGVKRGIQIICVPTYAARGGNCPQSKANGRLPLQSRRISQPSARREIREPFIGHISSDRGRGSSCRDVRQRTFCRSSPLRWDSRRPR